MPTTTTLAQQVTSIVGSWTPSDFPEFYKDAFNYIADVIPTDSELWANANLSSTTSLSDVTSTGEATFKILKVINDNKPAKEISYEDYLVGQDANSIYYNAKNYNNPLWTRQPDGTIIIAPSGGSAVIYYWPYTTDEDFDSVASNLLTSTLNGFPDEARLPAIIKAGINILYTKISDAVQEEEDGELLQMLQAQMQQLQQWYTSEMNRLHIPDKTLGVEKGNLK